MPTLYVHYKFGREILTKLPDNIQELLINKLSYYDMFNQGFDNLYYYHKNWNYYKNFGIQAHKNNIPLFFKNILEYIKDNNLQNDALMLSFILGFINHYTLDTLVHPFINYQVLNLNTPHTKIEFMLDYYFYPQKWQGKLYKKFIPKVKFNQNLIDLISVVFDKTYQEKNIGKIFRTSHNNGYYVYRYFIYDRLGLKTLIYKFIDKIREKKKFQFHENTFNIKKVNEEVLNNKHLEWHHPNIKKEIYKYSFQDIYDIAFKISIYLSNLTLDILNGNDKEEQFLKIINLIKLKNIPIILKQLP